MSRDRLSPLDASFLYMDGRVTRNQAVALTNLDGPIDFEQFRKEMAIKIGYVDRLRQIPVYSPLNLFHPTWEFDPDFDIDRHVHRISLKQETDNVEEIIEKIFATPLDPKHPLWRVYVIEDTPDEKTIHLLQLHHAVTDGIGFAHLALAFFDPRPSLDLELKSHETSVPRSNGAIHLLNGAIDASLGAPRYVSLNLRRAYSLLRLMFSSQGREVRKLFRRFRSAPAIRFPFNSPLSGEACYTWTSTTLDTIGAIRARHGGSVNDVVLALVTHAIQRYAEEEEIDTEGRYLRVLVPSNVRSDSTRNELGNFVAMAPVITPLGRMSAAERLTRITAYTQDMKRCGIANHISTAISFSQSLLPPPLSKILHRAYASLWQQCRLVRSGKTPSFNIVVTNVPGSPAPTYIAGRMMKDMSVLVPLLASIGLVCGAISNNGTLTITFTGDKKTVRDIGRLSVYIREALEELCGHTAVCIAE